MSIKYPNSKLINGSAPMPPVKLLLIYCVAVLPEVGDTDVLLMIKFDEI